jgi:hypothetical protein
MTVQDEVSKEEDLGFVHDRQQLLGPTLVRIISNQFIV